MKHDILMSHYPCYDYLINESEVIIMEYEAALQKFFRDIRNSGITGDYDIDDEAVLMRFIENGKV